MCGSVSGQWNGTDARRQLLNPVDAIEEVLEERQVERFEGEVPIDVVELWNESGGCWVSPVRYAVVCVSAEELCCEVEELSVGLSAAKGFLQDPFVDERWSGLVYYNPHMLRYEGEVEEKDCFVCKWMKKILKC